MAYKTDMAYMAFMTYMTDMTQSLFFFLFQQISADFSVPRFSRGKRRKIINKRNAIHQFSVPFPKQNDGLKKTILGIVWENTALGLGTKLPISFVPGWTRCSSALCLFFIDLMLPFREKTRKISLKTRDFFKEISKSERNPMYLNQKMNDLAQNV